MINDWKAESNALQGEQTSPIPNWLFEIVMPACKPNAWKVVCAVARKTWGWQHPDSSDESRLRKMWDVMSFSQFESLTGIRSRAGLKKAVDGALTSGFILRVKAGRSFRYRLANRSTSENVPTSGTMKWADGSNRWNANRSTSEKNKRKSKKRGKESGAVAPVPPFLIQTLKDLTGRNIQESREQEVLKDIDSLTPSLTLGLAVKFLRFWFENDWRGLKGERPTLRLVFELWPLAMEKGPREFQLPFDDLPEGASKEEALRHMLKHPKRLVHQ